MALSQTVLIVDDDPSTVLICRKALVAEGFHVLDASGSAEALKVCAEYADDIHLLLFDLFLPRPDFRLADAESEFPSVHGHQLLVRVICMSAASPAEIAAQGMKLGTIPFRLDRIPFLAKPFAMKGLLQVVPDPMVGPPLIHEECA